MNGTQSKYHYQASMCHTDQISWPFLVFSSVAKKLTFVKRLFWQLGTCFSGHCCCREVTVTERFKQEAMYGLSAGSKKVAVSRGSTVLPIQIASLSMYNYYFTTYRKIPKISPGAYIFQRPFLRGLFLEGLIFGGAYLRREICISNEEGYLPFLLCFTLYSRANSKYKPPRGLIFGGAI